MKEYRRPTIQRVNLQDLVDKEKSIVKIIKSGMVQILALLPNKDAYSKEKLNQLHDALLEAILFLSDTYKMELERIPIDSIIVRHNLEVITKVKSLFMQRNYIIISKFKLLDKLQA
ncbi:hypothetical protein J4404_01985 [Candidatus Woesearchaeota archaeon]|nr:hypothetical protein [Candidatus Woesearchaeota archaeon]